MKICTLRNENLYFAKWNLYFAKWKSVLCEMKICTLRNEILLYLQSWPQHTFFISFSSRHRTASSWCSENADLKTWDCRIVLSLFAAKCFGEFSTEHCAFSSAAFGSWWTSFAFDYINATITTRINSTSLLSLYCVTEVYNERTCYSNTFLSNIWWGILA